MFYEIFYPKEMREVIADLRAKGDLNERSINLYKRDLNILFLIYLLFLCSVFLFDPKDVTLQFLIVIMFVISMIATSRSKYYCNMKPYIYGNKKEGYALQDQKMSFGNTTFIKEKKTDRVYKIYLGSVHGAVKAPNAGDHVIFYGSDQFKYAMPCNYSFLEDFCLSLSISKGNLNESN